MYPCCTGGVPTTRDRSFAGEHNFGGDRNFGANHNFGGENQFGAQPKQPQYTPPQGGDQFTPPLPQQYGHGGDRTAVGGADTGGLHNNYTPQYGGRNASSFSEDTGAAGILQNFDNRQQHRQPASQYQDMPTSPPVADPYNPPLAQYAPQSSAGVSQRLPATSEPTIPPSGDIHTLRDARKTASGGRNSDEMLLQSAAVSHDYYPTKQSGGSIEQVVVPSSMSSPSSTFSRNNFDRSSSYSGQEKTHHLDTTPYGGYGDTVTGREQRLVAAAASHQDVGQSSSDAHGGVMAFMGKEHDLGVGQKPGIDLQKLQGVENTATQGKIRELEEQLQSKDQEKIEIKRTMERANAVLTNRIRRLEDQLKAMPNSTGSSNEVS